MPFTPFHFGPGLFIKSIVPKYFSLRIFILANVAIDLEPLYHLMTHQWPLHGIFHTYFGATFVGASCVLLGRNICGWTTRLWNSRVRNFTIPNSWISKRCLVLSSFVGTFSHVLLDSLMHRDMAPWYPFTSSNPLLHSISYSQIHLLCVLLGIVGMVIYSFSRLRH